MHLGRWPRKWPRTGRPVRPSGPLGARRPSTGCPIWAEGRKAEHSPAPRLTSILCHRDKPKGKRPNRPSGRPSRSEPPLGTLRPFFEGKSMSSVTKNQQKVIVNKAIRQPPRCSAALGTDGSLLSTRLEVSQCLHRGHFPKAKG